MAHDETEFAVSKIREAAGVVEAALESWIDVVGQVGYTRLFSDSLGSYKNTPVESYNSAQIGVENTVKGTSERIILIRQALDQVADEYEGTEQETKHEVKEVTRHRRDPDIW